MSNAAPPLRMPSLSCTMLAVDGKIMSGVAVATMMRSTSPGVIPADAIASRAACVARSEVVSSSAAMCRWRMPVRVRIHSSLVSTRFARSSLVSTCAGR
jgi:hypothetical protein